MNGMISSENVLAQDFSSAFFSLGVSPKRLSDRVICWLEFSLNDIPFNLHKLWFYYIKNSHGLRNITTFVI
jgi:hypothetical protein